MTERIKTMSMLLPNVAKEPNRVELVDDVVDINPNEYNELTFKIAIEGISEQPEKIELVLNDTELSYVFHGKLLKEGICKILIPPMGKRLVEGQVYRSKLALVLANQYFEPFQVNIKLKTPVKIHVESLSKPKIVVSSMESVKKIIEKEQKETQQEKQTKKEEEPKEVEKEIGFDEIIKPIEVVSKPKEDKIDNSQFRKEFDDTLKKRFEFLKEKKQAKSK